MTLVVALDTRDISEIARNPAAESSNAVVRMLQNGEVELGLSIVHLVELADPDFRSFDSARDFLRDVPLRVAVERSHVIDEEVACVCASLAGNTRRPPRVFVKDFKDWRIDIPAPPGFDLLYLLDRLRVDANDRERALSVAEHGAALSQAKAQAAVARDREGVAALYVRDHLNTIRPNLPHYCGGASPEDVINDAGGVESFPMLHVTLELARIRLLHRGKKTRRNDIVDEYLVSYSPYAAVTTLDGPTFARYRDAKLPYLQRVTPNLADIPLLLERIRNGEIPTLPSA